MSDFSCHLGYTFHHWEPVPIDQVKGSNKFGRNVECDEEGTEINPRRSDRTGRISTRVTKFRDFVMG